MWQQEHIFEPDILGVEFWFPFVDIETCCSEPSAFESLDQVLILDEAAARCVHHDGALRKQRNRPRVKEMVSCWCLGRIQAQELTDFQQPDGVSMKHCVTLRL